MAYSSITERKLSEPFELQLARGQIPGHKHVFKYGFNGAVGNSAETIWAEGGVYTWITTASVMKVSSSHANDSAGSTGAITVMIEGLDADYNEVSELVTITGTTDFTTNQVFWRVHRAYVVTAGSTGSNVGVIYVYTGADTAGVPNNADQIFTTIAATEGQTLQALYTVPAGKTAYLSHVSAGSKDGTNATTMTLRARKVGEAFRTKEKFIVFKSQAEVNHHIPIKFVEKTDIEVLGIASASTTDVAADFDLTLVDN